MSKEKVITSSKLRKLWVDFFISKQHFFINSSSLVPIDDDSLLWINSGVATLKKYFEGLAVPPSTKLVNYQKSLRTNDIDNVGITSRHHTFFEMIGFFSIGDYFSKEATSYAWEFLTSEAYLNLNTKNIYITVHKDDHETYNNWLNCGVEKDHIFKLGNKTNFWDIGKGPSGPNTEIFYDRGKEFDSRGPELIKNDIENDRYIEILNIVLSKFNNNGNGEYSDLPQKNIDTGGGFERLLSILQDTPSNFETDLFLNQIVFLEKFSTKKYAYNYKTNLDLTKEQQVTNALYKSIVDFFRATIVGISDGVVPSNLGRGYILRRLLRKSVINLEKLDIDIYKIVESLIKITIDTLKEPYPELLKNQDRIIILINQEFLSFKLAIDKAKIILDKNLEAEVINNIVNPSFVFKLFETYGLPKEIIAQILLSKNLSFDEIAFKDLFDNFREISKQNSNKNSALSIQNIFFTDEEKTKFIGYETLKVKSKLKLLDSDDNFLYLVFEETPFYSNSGGQVSDKGLINNKEVLDVFKTKNGTIVHKLSLEYILDFKLNEDYSLNVDEQIREKISINHSSTHLTFAALEKILNMELPQRGSKVDENFLRFDFSYHQKLSLEMISEAELIIKDWIDKNILSKTLIMSKEAAIKYGARFLDTFQYGSEVRVVEFPGISLDLCGGTHIDSTSKIQSLKIVSLESKGSGIYRLMAITTDETIKQNSKLKIQSKKEEFLENIRLTSDVIYKSIVNFPFLNLQDLKKDMDTFIINIQTDLNISKSLEQIEKLSIQFNKYFKDLESKIINYFISDKNNFESKIIYFENLDKKFLNKITKLLLKEVSGSTLLININQNKDDLSILIILPKQNLVQFKSSLDEIKSIGFSGGGSNQYYQFKGNKDQLQIFLDKIWKY